MVIAINGEPEFPGNVRKIWLKAQTAFELSNYEYAKLLLKAVLVRFSDFEGAKSLLRECGSFINGQK